MSKVSNALLMLEYLKNGRKYSVKELSEKLEVSQRMIREYKDDLEKAGIFIDAIMGPYGGYVLKRSVNIPVRNFSKEEYTYLKELQAKENSEKLNNIINKVQSLIEVQSVKVESDVKDYYNVLCRAVKEHKKVKINYYSYVNGNQDRVIRPLDIFLYNNGWGCAAYCELKKDLRHFELKRINSIELLEETF